MKFKRSLLPLLAIFLVCLYPGAFYYLQNADEAHPVDILPMLGLLLLTAAVLFLISFLILRRFDAAGLFTGVAMILVGNSGLISRYLKYYFRWYHDRYLLILVAVLLVLLLLLLVRKKKFPAWECCAILAILFGALTVIRLIPAIPTLWTVHTTRMDQLDIDPEQVTFQGEKPNVYYFIVDEYGGTENLSRYFDFDNEEFVTYLKDNKFNVSDTTENTESIWTATLVPNLLNISYAVEDEIPARAKEKYMDNPLLMQLFRNNGYQVNLISDQAFVGETGATLISPKQYPERITGIVFDHSIYAVLPYVRGWLRDRMGLEDTMSRRDHLLEIFQSMETCTDYVGSEPTLTVGYVGCPHYPFVFDAEGNPTDQHQNVKDHHYYLDQIRYLNSVLEITFNRILEKDPEAVIVIQSDHGARYPGQMLLFYGEPDYDPFLETPFMQNSLNCVYWGGRALEIEGETGINTWRILLNEMFGTDFSMLTPPEGYTCYGKSWHDKPYIPEHAVRPS